MPRIRAEIETLPGAGRKTANVVLNMAYGDTPWPSIPRISRRYWHGLAPGNTPIEVELGLEGYPPEFMLHAHHWLILHGRYTCLARKPRCEVCLITISAAGQKDWSNFCSDVVGLGTCPSSETPRACLYMRQTRA